MAAIPHALPSTAGTAGDAGRQLAQLLGPGWQAPDGSVLADDLVGLGSAIAALRATTAASLAEAFVTEADQCLSEWEVIFGLPVRPDLSDAARRALLTARAQATKGGTPNLIKAALDVLATTPVAIAEGFYDPLGVAREVFRFSIVLSAADYANVYLKARMTAIVDIMKPAHVGYRFVKDGLFRFDDAAHGFDTGALAGG